MDPSNPTVVLVAAMVMVTAFASVPVAAEEVDVTVETEQATDVTSTSATLHGNLTVLENASNASVSFEYWIEGDPDNSTTTSAQEVNETGTFSEHVEGLEPNTTYKYLAHAEAGDRHVLSGGEEQFTTKAESEGEPSENEAFGQRVAQLVRGLLSGDTSSISGDTDRPLGQMISEWVTQHNPGADKRSDKANPGGNGNGPPDHAGPNSDKSPPGQQTDDGGDEDESTVDEESEEEGGDEDEEESDES